MIQSISLQNFKSFGELQTVPIEPITVLVGPNNSGKSNFMSVGRFISNCTVADLLEAVRQEGGGEFLIHRPSSQDALCTIGWSTPSGSYSMKLLLNVPVGHVREEEFKRADTTEGFFRRGTVLSLGTGANKIEIRNLQSLLI